MNQTLVLDLSGADPQAIITAAQYATAINAAQPARAQVILDQLADVAIGWAKAFVAGEIGPVATTAATTTAQD